MKHRHTQRPVDRAVALRPFESLPQVHSMGRLVFDPIWALRAHHSGGCELMHIIRGKVRVKLGRKALEAGPGDTLMIPSQSLHRDLFDLSAGLEVFMVMFSWTAEGAFFRHVAPDAAQKCPAPVIAEITRLLVHMRQDLTSGTAADRLVGRAHLLTILLLLLRHNMKPAENGHAAKYGLRHRRELMLQARQYLDAHFSEPVTLDAIADFLRVSPYYLSHVFSQESDFSLFSYLTSIRMEHANRMLQEGERNVSEVARAVGYEDGNYFAKVFRRHFGRSPKTMRP